MSWGGGRPAYYIPYNFFKGFLFAVFVFHPFKKAFLDARHCARLNKFEKLTVAHVVGEPNLKPPGSFFCHLRFDNFHHMGILLPLSKPCVPPRKPSGVLGDTYGHNTVAYTIVLKNLEPSGSLTDRKAPPLFIREKPYQSPFQIIPL